jgi:hypothetical protein
VDAICICLVMDGGEHFLCTYHHLYIFFGGMSILTVCPFKNFFLLLSYKDC